MLPVASVGAFRADHGKHDQLGQPFWLLELRQLRRHLRAWFGHHVGVVDQQLRHEHHQRYVDGRPARCRRRCPVQRGEPVGDRDTQGVQFAVGYSRDNFDAVLRMSYQETHTGGLGYETLDNTLAALGGVTADPFDSVLATDIDTFDDIESSDVSLHLTWELGNDMKLTSITAWHENDSPNDFDVDGSAIFLTSAGFADRNSETLSQELRLTGTTGLFNWVVGGIVFDESIDTTIELGYSDTNLLFGTPLCTPAFEPIFGPCQPSVLEVAQQEGDYFSAGLYGDVSWQITDDILVGAGLRYSYDDKEFDYQAAPVTSVIAALNATELNPSGNLLGYATDGVESLDDDWDDWQPRLYASWQFTDRHTLFANAAKGFKAGGFDPEATRELSVFDPEEVWNLDMGVRGDIVEHRLRYQLTGFLYDYEDYQVQIIENGIAQTGNVDGVDGHGIELELSWSPVEGLTLGANGAWLDAEFKRTVTDTGDLEGNRPVLSPEYSGSFTIGWRSPKYAWGSLGLNWLSAWQDEVFFSVLNLEEQSQDSYWRHDARLSWYSTNDRWRVDLFGRNLDDEDYVIFQDDVGAGLVSRRGEPRFIGAAVNFSM